MKFFDSKGKILTGYVIFDRDGFLKTEVEQELNNVHIDSYPARSDLVRCFYAKRFWNANKDGAGSHQSVFVKI